jgi:type II secretion system protein H
MRAAARATEPTLGTGTRGFTLVEILVVVAIVGIVLVVVAPNLFPTDAEIARRETSNVALALERARDEAWFGGRATALSFEPGRMREWHLAGQAWKPDDDNATRLSSELAVERVSVDGQDLKPGERLLFLADGLGSPFAVSLRLRGIAWSVEGDAAGAITMNPR